MDRLTELLGYWNNSLPEKVDYADLVCAPAFARGYRMVYEDEYGYMVEDTIKALEELQQYRRAEQNGLLLRLPCKVGDTVFVLMKRGGATDISNGKVRKIHCGNDGIWWVEFCDLWVDVEFGDFGKIAFLSREDAEAKLAERKDGHE